MRLIVIAGIIAFPISYLVMNYWLQGYAYRIQIQIWWLVGIFITITRNKTRSLLTAFGVFWGIFMLVALWGVARDYKI